MKRHIRITTAAAVVLLGLTACDRSILNVTPKDQLSEELVFADANLAEAYLSEIYRGLGDGFRAFQLWVDESHYVHRSSVREVQSLYTPSDIRLPRTHDWDDNYSHIRLVNIFLEKIDEADFDQARKDHMKGEALFLRAFFYHNLMGVYGGVPLVSKVYGLEDDFEAPRNSFKETVDFIVADADAAAALLPPRQTGANEGRASKAAALALKSRVLLRAASDLYTTNPSGMAETGYTGSVDRTALWRAAQQAAKDVMDLGAHSLFRPDPASPEAAAKNFHDIWMAKGNDEAILSRFFVVTQGAPRVNRSLGPNGYHNWGGDCPVGNLVDAFRMVDGSKFDWNNPAHAAAPYENRDPRFYGSILYDGAPFRQRPADVIDMDPYGVIQTFRALTLPDGTKQPGLDTRASPVEDWNGCYTGYLQLKAIDPSVDGQFFAQEVPWLFFRYAEVLLNYAEASIELGETGNALGALNQIRRRAGLPTLDGLSNVELREEYRNERRIELAFEQHRFFDVRRWMIAPVVLDEPGMGIDIFIDGTDPVDRSTWTNYRYVPVEIQDRDFKDQFYFMPIRRDEMNRNSLLVQNPGY